MQPTYRLSVVAQEKGLPAYSATLYQGRTILTTTQETNARLLVHSMINFFKRQGLTCPSLNIDTNSLAFLRDFLFNPMVMFANNQTGNGIPNNSPNLKAHSLICLGTPVLVRYTGSLLPIEA